MAVSAASATASRHGFTFFDDSRRIGTFLPFAEVRYRPVWVFDPCGPGATGVPSNPAACTVNSNRYPGLAAARQARA